MDAGSGQTLSATFTPQDSIDYATITATTTITVEQATPTPRAQRSRRRRTMATRSRPPSRSPARARTTRPAASLGGVTPTLTYYDGSGTSGTSLGARLPRPPAPTRSWPASPAMPITRPSSPRPSRSRSERAPPTIALTSSTGSAVYGQPITFVATVAAAVTPSGTVTFLDGGTTLATVALDGSGTATLTTHGPGRRLPFDHRDLQRRRRIDWCAVRIGLRVCRPGRHHGRSGTASGLEEEESGIGSPDGARSSRRPLAAASRPAW